MQSMPLSGRRWAWLPAVMTTAAVAFTCSCSAGHPAAYLSTATPTPATTSAATNLVTIPNLVGQVYETAQMRVAMANLPTGYRLEHSATVVAGSVISQTPAAGARVTSQTTVTIVVSIGPSSIAGAQPCQAAHLKVRRGPPVSEMTQQRTADWSFTNLAAPCLLDGYPAVAALDKAGQVLGFRYTHSGDQMTTGAMPMPVYLPAGSTSWIRMNRSGCVTGVQDTATTLRLTLPAGGGTLDVPAAIDFCADTFGRIFAVSPFEPVRLLLNSSP
ncbi:MAG: PASTA domain-containing protein [Actinobacteria bacterium]|nr:PASTA domain-containing protein [Actinomycetota bacterium]